MLLKNRVNLPGSIYRFRRFLRVCFSRLTPSQVKDREELWKDWIPDWDKKIYYSTVSVGNLCRTTMLWFSLRQDQVWAARDTFPSPINGTLVSQPTNWQNINRCMWSSDKYSVSFRANRSPPPATHWSQRRSNRQEFNLIPIYYLPTIIPFSCHPGKPITAEKRYLKALGKSPGRVSR